MAQFLQNCTRNCVYVKGEVCGYGEGRGGRGGVLTPQASQVCTANCST